MKPYLTAFTVCVRDKSDHKIETVPFTFWGTDILHALTGGKMIVESFGYEVVSIGEKY